MQVVEHIRRVNAGHHLETQHAAGTLESLGGQMLIAGTGQSRVMHRLDQRVHQQVAGNGIGVLLLTVHAQGQSLNAAAYRVALSGSQHTTQTVLRKVHAVRQILTGNDHQTGVHIRMTGQILGGGVNHHIRTQRKRLLQVRVTNVLSTIESAPKRWATVEMARTSFTLSSGLVRVSK
ncbi:Uncharacterised protein [Bifidobacterium bifidum]|nr:Uncharacterised protein [Bifidobacterium bifidum]